MITQQTLTEELVREHLNGFSLYRLTDLVEFDFDSRDIFYTEKSIYRPSYDVTQFSLSLTFPAHIHSFSINPNFRGEQFGKELYDLVEDIFVSAECPEIYLHPKIQAIGFWKKMGFEEYFNDMVKRF